MLRLAVVIALNAGLRKSEILKLRKADLDFERELIIIRKAKTGNRYALMNSLVRQAIFWTVNLGALGPDELVLGGIDWIKDTWPQVCKEAKVSNLHFHDMRATYTTRMLENGFDAFTACDATGQVVRVFFPAHADANLVIVEQLRVISGRVLHPAIGMMNQPRRPR